MQYSSFVLALFAATGAMAAPTRRGALNKPVVVTLGNSKIGFNGNERQVKEVHWTGLFEQVAVDVSADLAALRCQIVQTVDGVDQPIVILRGENTDITFGDGDKGAWTLRTPSKVDKVICDPAFSKAFPSDAQVIVQLNEPVDEGARQTQPFSGTAREVQASPSDQTVFSSVEIIVGSLVEDQDIRCQLVDIQGNAINAQRGANKDTTFSDAGKGLWNFIDAQGNPAQSKVHSVICDPDFVSAN